VCPLGEIMPKLVVALDIDKKSALKIINELEDCVHYFKVGHRLFTGTPEILDILNKKGKKIFIDLKYHDIPTVVGLAVEEIVNRYKPFALTLHTSGGRNMMKEAVKTKDKFSKNLQPLLFGVTLLTSLTHEDLKFLGITPQNYISKLASLAKESGLDGVVCSGHEIELIKSVCGKDFLTLVPGISTITHDGTGKNIQKDQKRTVSIREAVSKGADFIVAGRLVYNSPLPEKTVGEIYEHFKTF
jgi:orotidine-5'-phosphate decarboxylase